MWQILYILLLFTMLLYGQDTIEENIKQARLLYIAGDKQNALKIAKECLQNPPNTLHMKRELATVFIVCGDKDTGFKIFRELSTQFPSYELHEYIGDMAQAYQKWDIASENYHACLRIKKSQKIYKKLAMIAERQKNYDLSIQYAFEATKLIIADVRSLNFRKTVHLHTKSRKILEEEYLQEMDEEWTETKTEAVENSLKFFGFIPEECNIKTTLAGVLSEQVAGFYDIKTKKLYLVVEPTNPTGWKKLLGHDKQSFEDQTSTIAHEMVHALQDQYYDIGKMDKAVEDNDDRYTALQSLLEGDAMLGMFDYYYYPGYLLLEDIPATRFDMKFMSFILPMLESPRLTQSPMIIRESLYFPYTEGLTFCLSLRTDKMLWKKINACYRKLPSSTEHILHPEKYTNGEPVWDCTIPNFSDKLGKEWRQVNNNVMGEFGCQMLFKQYQITRANHIASGWGGDRYSILVHAGGSRCLIWVSYWDSISDSIEFFNAMKELLAYKYPKAIWQHGKEVSQAVWNGTVIYVYRYHQRVWILEQIPQSGWDSLRREVLTINFRKQ